MFDGEQPALGLEYNFSGEELKCLVLFITGKRCSEPIESGTNNITAQKQLRAGMPGSCGHGCWVFFFFLIQVEGRLGGSVG